MSNNKTESLGLLQKITNIRVEFQKNPPEATGNIKIGQTHTFNYLELKDFLPKLNDLCNEQKVFNHITFSESTATLKIIDMENPKDELIFETPFITSIQIGNCNAMQNCGGAQTYARRYLYYLAYDIQANDLSDYASSRGIVNSNSNYNAKPANVTSNLATDKQKNYIQKLLKTADAQTKNAIKEKYDLEKLTSKEASAIIESLKNNPKPKKETPKKELVDEEFPDFLNDDSDIAF